MGDQAFLEVHELQPPDAHPLQGRHRLRQDRTQQRDPQRSHEEEEGQAFGEDKVRGEIQVRQEQMVLPKVEVLNFPLEEIFMELKFLCLYIQRIKAVIVYLE